MIRIRILKWQGEYKVQELIEPKDTVGAVKPRKTLSAHTFASRKALESAEQVARELCKRFGLKPQSVEYKLS